MEKAVSFILSGVSYFSEVNWVQMRNSQGLRPLQEYLGNIVEAVVKKCVDVMPAHVGYIAKLAQPIRYVASSVPHKIRTIKVAQFE